MILAAHQPNFAPWLTFFDKMNKADIFVILTHCQFEKNGWQNRCSVNGNYWTKPVCKGLDPIREKKYTDGQSLLTLNMMWINTIARTLNIDTQKIRMDFSSASKGTEYLIQLCQYYNCDKYLTNPEAIDKYLDEKLMNFHNIEVIPCYFPYKIHTFEAFEEWGIEKTIKLLNREKNRCVQ